MTVLLHGSADTVSEETFDSWAAIPPASPPLDPARRRPGLAADLESAFDSIVEAWWLLGRTLGSDKTATLAHSPACVTNASDLGLMMAWAELAENWAREPETTLLICDDPWLYRHLASRPGGGAASVPHLAPRRLWPAIRGYLARVAAAARSAFAALRTRALRVRNEIGGPALLVYGHPASDATGRDAYFGDLLRRFPDLTRVLHVDCPAARALELGRDGRTVSLHGWGSFWYALTLPFARWRPARKHRNGKHGWLVRRAAAIEGGTGQAAMIRWQTHCQERWLRAQRPDVVAWPWENHSWERTFVRTARRLGVRTVGYQHSVIGRQMLNYAPASNPDGVESIPDLIMCAGPATRDQLAAWGIPPERLRIGGALRFPAVTNGPRHKPDAPVLLALPFDGPVAAEMVEAARKAAKRGHRFLVKPHPMTPHVFAESPGVAFTDQPLAQHEALSAVVYAASTVGLEALLLGLPTLRFRPADRISIDILPTEIEVSTTDAGSFANDLEDLRPPPAVTRAFVFAPVDDASWGALFTKRGNVR